jgi:hypothetical protein
MFDIRGDMRHVEAVIRVFEPGFDVRRITARRRNHSNGLFKRGILFRSAMDALRKAPMLQIVEAMLAANGGPEPSKKQVRGPFVLVPSRHALWASAQDSHDLPIPHGPVTSGSIHLLAASCPNSALSSRRGVW